jgi:hypothetical protein
MNYIRSTIIEYFRSLDTNHIIRCLKYTKKRIWRSTILCIIIQQL